MKKKLLCLIVFIISGFVLQAQVIYDNGPQVNFAGGGFNNSDVSHLHDGMTTYGLGHAVSTGYRMADDFVIQPWESWTIDSLIFYAYQTNSTTATTFSEYYFKIWDGVPEAPGSTVVFGDDVTNVLVTSDWTGMYRTGDFTSTACEPLTCTARPVMRNAVVAGVTLTGGTYWIDWACVGSLASGPWCPFVNLGSGVTVTGNAMQYNIDSLLWLPVVDVDPQGLPFQVVGTILITGLNSHEVNQSVTVYPNPASEKAWVNINLPVQAGATYSFELFDVLGKSVYKENNITANKFELNRGSLSKGVYTYILNNADAPVAQGKLVFE